ncbi:hypothetical protein IMZ48_24790 [Candidatus Bathyarchaeota archaeon]|nr:hypothetical protein [Candidatus Bathyarchaeota archaeon]
MVRHESSTAVLVTRSAKLEAAAKHLDMGFVGLRASSDQEELLTLDGAAFSLVMREA